MKTLSGIMATGQQRLSTMAYNGDVIEMTLYFQSRTGSWKIDVSCDDFTVKGLRVSHVPNILSQYKNIIPFGIGVVITDGGEPFLINDFSTGRVELAILSPDEVDSIEDLYAG